MQSAPDYAPPRKVTADHLSRDAYLYVRQSTLRQVYEHGESTQRQYALRDRAVALGWPNERIIVIDSDLGRSGAGSDEREGFQRLVAEVGMGRAGLVMGLEVSRLARNSSDWHRLLEICAVTDTLILDEDGLYDVSHFNDRLLLGLKGTMSEAELHFLKARMRGGQLSKARRGELKLPLPVGFVYDDRDAVVFDPDRQVQQCILCLFETFRRTGSATATVKEFRRRGVLFPQRIGRGFRKGELHWVELLHSRTLQILHNPRYAGAFFYGRVSQELRPGGHTRTRRRPREEWIALFPDAHAGYITWDEYEANQRRLRENAQGYGSDRHRRSAREGPALLQGLAMCARCGRRMTVRYHTRQGRTIPDYYCQREGIEHARPVCLTVPGECVDGAIAELLIDSMTPVSLEVALSVQAELLARTEEADRLRHQQVERARYEADLARRRYLSVDPDNRLVADQLEADWNERLRLLDDARQTYESQREQDRLLVDERLRTEILSLTRDFPRLWRRTSDQERKRMVRLLIEDVTMMKEEDITLHVRFRGGAVQTLHLPRPLGAPELRRTSKEVIAEIDRLLDDHLESEIAEMLNERSLKTSEGRPFTAERIKSLRYDHGLKTRYERLRARGLLTSVELATRLGCSTYTVRRWHEKGLIHGHVYTMSNRFLYERPDEELLQPTLNRIQNCPAAFLHELTH